MLAERLAVQRKLQEAEAADKRRKDAARDAKRAAAAQRRAEWEAEQRAHAEEAK